jgi:hypothetical protein
MGEDEWCAGSFTYDGHVSEGGCNTASGTWDNTLGYSRTFTMTKSCAVPTSETTASGIWAGPYHIFTATISEPSSGPLGGRYVRETDYSPGIDGCYYTGSTVPEWTAVSNQNPQKLGGNFFLDTIGWTNANIIHYRSAGRTPCNVNLFQRTGIACGHESNVTWFTVDSRVLVAEINPTTLRTSRGSLVVGPINY